MLIKFIIFTLYKLKNSIMKFLIELTWSKVMALLVLAAAVTLDILNKQASTFMYALPFVVFLITGKQYIDNKKK